MLLWVRAMDGDRARGLAWAFGSALASGAFVIPWKLASGFGAADAAVLLLLGVAAVINTALAPLIPRQRPLWSVHRAEIWLSLQLAILALVMGFRHSSNLAAAYGVAVTGTMLTTTLLLHTIARDRWKWPLWQARAMTAALLTVDGAFFSTGQRCTASSRIIVHEAVHDQLVDRLVAAAEKLRVGHALDPQSQMGPVVDQAQLEQDLAYIDIGRQEGAELVAGGSMADDAGNGHYLRPTVFTGVSNEMRIAREEIFGPVASVIRAADFEEALALANDTSFGLGSYLYTTDKAQAERVADRIEAGMVYVNLVLADEPGLPFGGVKRSGTARELGTLAADEFVNKKLIRVGP